MDVDNGGMFLKNCEAFRYEIKWVYSYHFHKFPIKNSWKMGTWFKT